MGEFAWRPGWTEAQLIDGPTGCLSIDVHDQNIAATTSADADAGTYRIVLYRATELGFEVDIEGGTSLPPDQDMSLNERVSLTSSDVYFASGQVIGRKRKSSDDSNIIFRLRPDAACELGLGGRAAVDFRVVEFAEAGLDGGTDAGLLVLYRGSNGFRLGRHDDTCCIVGDEKDVCPEIPLILNSGYQAIVIHEPYVYYLPENELLRASIMDPDDAATLIRGNLGEVVGSLAIDDQYAYFGVANRILRLALPP
jgi:hypothetical protein